LFFFRFLYQICDRTGISNMYSFIWPCSITYVHGAPADAEMKKTIFIVNTMKACQRSQMYFAPFYTG